MTDMNGNPYLTAALSEYATENRHQHQATIAATLALAYEQRTMALIAAMPVLGQYEETRDLMGDALEQITTRLGLDGDHA